MGILDGLTRNAVIAATKEFDKLGRSEFLGKYRFGKSTEYFLEFRNKLYDSKAVAGAAFGHEFPKSDPLTSKILHGGAPTVRPLQKLGFRIKIVAKREKPGSGDNGKLRVWTRQEVMAAINAYFEMLAIELAGKQYKKRGYITRTADKTDGRTKGSVEFKFGNISAVLNRAGLPFIDGYKPARNVQKLLEEMVHEWVEAKGEKLFGKIAKPETTDIPLSELFTKPPSPKKRESAAKKPILIDWGERESRVRKLGKDGEAFVVDVEKRRLTEAKQEGLAERVEWVSQTQGDGLGYDISSFDEHGNEIFIEVKTTTAGAAQYFFATRNEVEVSKGIGKAYKLYRVYNFAKSPRLYVLEGSLTGVCNLEPSTFKALPK